MTTEWDLEKAAADDAFAIAVLIEQGGIDFYERLLSRQSDARVKKELEFLRDEEVKHRALFLSFLSSRDVSPDRSPPAGLQAAVRKEFIEPLEKLFASFEVTTNERALSFGQELERKSIQFYRALLPAMDPGRSKDIQRIIEEEEKHLRQLQLLRAYF